MSNELMKELIIKDLYMMRTQILCYGALCLLSFAVMAIPLKNFGHYGSIILVSAIVAYYCHIVMKLVVIEQKNKNHLFIMTLPTSANRIAYAKLISCVATFMLLWAPVSLALFFLLHNLPAWPAVSFAFYSVIFVSFIPGFLSILAVALSTRSEGWTILTLVISNLLVTITINAFPSTAVMKHGFSLGSIAEVGVTWPDITNTVLLNAVTISVVIICFSLISAHRQREFI